MYSADAASLAAVGRMYSADAASLAAVCIHQINVTYSIENLSKITRYIGQSHTHMHTLTVVYYWEASGQLFLRSGTIIWTRPKSTWPPINVRRCKHY